MAVGHDEIHTRAADGTPLFAQRWSPTDGAARAELLVLHGYGEHGGRYRELAHFLTGRGLSTLAVDLRGHGRSGRERGFVESFSDYHLDLEAGLAIEGPPVRFLLGHSNGGLVALDYAASRRLDVTGLVVTNPFVALAMEVPPYKQWLGEAAAGILPRLKVPSGIDPAVLTHDAALVEKYRHDPLVFTTATAGWYREVQAAQRRVAEIREIPLPLLYVYSDSDRLASPRANRVLAEQIASPDKTVWLRLGELHEVLNELGRASLFAQVADWLEQHLPAAA